MSWEISELHLYWLFEDIVDFHAASKELKVLVLGFSDVLEWPERYYLLLLLMEVYYVFMHDVS